MSSIDPPHEFDATTPCSSTAILTPKTIFSWVRVLEVNCLDFGNTELLRSLFRFANSARQMPSAEENEGQEISDWARRCEELFQKLQSTLVGHGGIGTHHRTLRDYSQRFELWAGFIGVFADGGASLDNRLRFYPEVRNLVLKMLRLLERNLSHVSRMRL
ncbi:hypothetical protein F4860DRAFT_357228 [Xylaria cubensis]|nr:hypothetical protein F4860DRAFT_357228 [Xylaria cubensis]